MVAWYDRFKASSEAFLVSLRLSRRRPAKKFVFPAGAAPPTAAGEVSFTADRQIRCLISAPLFRPEDGFRPPALPSHPGLSLQLGTWLPDTVFGRKPERCEEQY